MIERLFRRPSTHRERLSRAKQAAADSCERELRARDKTLGRRPSAVWVTAGAVLAVEPIERGARLRCERGELLVEWLTLDCLRIRRVQMLAQHPLLREPEMDSAPPHIKIEEQGKITHIATSAAHCRVDGTNGQLFVGLAGDEAEVSMTLAWQTGVQARLRLALPPAVHVYGMGGRGGALDLRGSRQTLWAGDALPIASPTLLLTGDALHYGVCWRDPARLTLDCGASRPDELLLDAAHDFHDVLIFIASAPVAVLAAMQRAEGAFPLPPLWAFGYQYRGSDADDEEAMAALALAFRAREMPCDVLHLGSALLDGEQGLTIDPVRFPAPRALIDALHGEGFQVTADVQPALLLDAAPARTTPQDMLLTYADGMLVRAAGAGGVSAYPDFARDAVCDWWSAQVGLLTQTGIDGLVCRDSAPRVARAAGAGTLPDAAQHRLGEGTMTHAAVHNAYGQRMAAASLRALEQHRLGLRSLALFDSAGLGAQRIGMPLLAAGEGWGGLREQFCRVLNAALSGMPLSCVEVSGEEGELMTRALQAACLLPGVCGGLPWLHGQPYELVNRLTLNLRMRLTSYLYSCTALAREYGTPIIRPLWLVDPHDAALRDVSDACMIGEHLLIAPVLHAGMHERTVRLPAGLWYDFWTNERVMGGRLIHVPAPLERLPLFVRAGAVLPLGDPMEHMLQRPPERLTLRVYPGDGETTLYEDHGEGTAYEHGEYRWMYYTAAWENSSLFSLTRRLAGKFMPPYATTRLEIIGLGEQPQELRLDRHGAPLWYYDEGMVEVAADDTFGRLEVWMAGSPTSPTRKRRALV
jgi:alpha-glucosidase